MNKKIFSCCFFFSFLLPILAFSKTNSFSSRNSFYLTSINIINRNGLSETISSKEKLKEYQKIDFLSPQSFQKVLRTFKTKNSSLTFFIITSYHSNGQIKQYLEAKNNRAYGSYREWYNNGALKISADVIGGIADLNVAAESSWLFDKSNYVYSEEGNLLAHIVYDKGVLSGESTYYHNDGNIWKIKPYKKGFLDGEYTVFLKTGQKLLSIPYKDGSKNGTALRYHINGSLASKEIFKDNGLIEAVYYNQQQTLISQIKNGSGYKVIFGENIPCEIQKYENGTQQGEVLIFNNEGQKIQSYITKNSLKHGPEWFYFPTTGAPKLMLSWEDGVLQGTVKSWYPEGVLESQKEMYQNNKNGLLTIWYPEGSVMMIEEYDHNKLIKGEYYKKGERLPFSKVEKGAGTTSIFSPSGTLLNKIIYQDGKPISD